MTDTNQKSDTTKSGLTGLMDKVKDSVTSALDTTKDVVAEKAHQAKDYLKDDLEKTKADVHFLDFKREDPDLRQDTLRKVEFINGRPWVLVEIRDLKDETLKALIGHEKK